MLLTWTEVAELSALVPSPCNIHGVGARALHVVCTLRVLIYTRDHRAENSRGCNRPQKVNSGKVKIFLNINVKLRAAAFSRIVIKRNLRFNFYFKF